MTAPISADEARRLREAATAVADAWGNPEPPEDDMNAADRMWFVAMDAADTLVHAAAEVERLTAENERLRGVAHRLVLLGMHPICEMNARNGRTVCSSCEVTTLAAATLADEGET